MKKALSIIQIWLQVFFLFLAMPLFSQQAIHKFVAYSNEQYKSDTAAERIRRDTLYKKYDPLFGNKIWLSDYVKVIQEDEDNMASAGAVYKNWNEATQYLNAVIKEALGKEWKKTNEVQIVRNEENNAFMLEDGKIYIFAGLIAAANSEAELVSTIGHEFGHYINQHSYKNFMKHCEVKDRINTARLIRYPGSGLATRNATSDYYSNSRENESEADNISIACMKASRYDLGAVAGHFKHVLEEEKKRAIEKGRGTFVYNKTHPATQDRLTHAVNELKKADTVGRKKFLINETLFRKIKKQAIDECIFLNLRNLDFKSVIEMCYEQLLFDPNDEFYLFYLNESIRRYLLIKPQESDNYFITNEYFLYEKYIPKEKLAKMSLSKKVPKIVNFELGKTISYQYEYLLLNNNKAEIDNLPSNCLTRSDTIEFTTYSEALEFFVKRQEALAQTSVNFVKKMMNPDTTVGLINSKNLDLNTYNDIIKALNNKVVESDVAIIPLGLDYEKSATVFWKADMNESNLYSEMVKSLELTCRYPFYVVDFRKLSLIDRRMLYDFLDNLKQFSLKQEEVNKFYKDRKNINYDMYKSLEMRAAFINPEIIPFLRKNHLGKILFLDMYLGEVASTVSVSYVTIPVGSSKYIELANYYIDVDNAIYVNQHYVKKVGKMDFAPQALANEIYRMSQSLTEDVKNNRKQ